MICMSHELSPNINLNTLLPQSQIESKRQNLSISLETSNKFLSAAVAVADWGVEIKTGEDLQKEIASHTGSPGQTITGDTGFSHSRWSLPVDVDQFGHLQVGAARHALSAALKLIGAEPDRITRLSVGTSIPAYPELAYNIASVSDIKTESVELGVAACYSSDYWFSRQVMEAKNGRGGLHAIVGIEKENYQVEVVEDGEAGLGKIKEGGYDLILLDVMLPKMDGIAVLSALAAETPRASNGKIVLLTNLTHNPALDEAEKLGASGHIDKAAISPDKFIEKVKSFLQ